MNPSSETLRARIKASLVNEPAPARSAVVFRDRVLLALGVVLMTVTFLALGGPRLGSRSAFATAASAALWGASAMLVSFAALRRGRAGLGSTTNTLWSAALATAPILVASFLLVLSVDGSPAPQTPFTATLGCLGATLAMTSAPFFAVLLARRGSDPVHPRATAAGIGAASGAWAGVLIDLHCPAMHVAHVTVGHVLPTVLAIAFGALVGDRMLGIRADVGSRTHGDR